MKVLGIAAEYNPFHNGHKYHIEESKKITGADTVVAVMSGDFVQRGEPAVSDKWTRAAMACRNGADLVIELPFIYACNGASQFAKGSVGILDNLGCVDFISFGSESGDIESLESFALKDHSFDSRDLTYADNMGIALKESGLSSDANNILAVEYLKAINEKKADLTPVTVKRCDRGYSSYEVIDDFASASKIRDMMLKGEDYSSFVPERDSFKPMCFNDDVKDMVYRMVSSEIIRQDPEILDSVPAAGEGIGFKLKKEIRKADSFDALVDRVRAGRYTSSRIRRVLMQILIGAYGPVSYDSYGRILAFSDRGAKLLKHIKKNENAKNGFKIITNINKEDVSEIRNTLKFDITASDMYNLLMRNEMYGNSDQVNVPRMCIK